MEPGAAEVNRCTPEVEGLAISRMRFRGKEAAKEMEDEETGAGAEIGAGEADPGTREEVDDTDGGVEESRDAGVENGQSELGSSLNLSLIRFIASVFDGTTVILFCFILLLGWE